jgi:gliding motility-associated-like protein
MRTLAKASLLFLLLFFYQSLFSQTYTTNGSATQNSCNCYTLTTDVLNQSGSVWNDTKMDLRQPFDFAFNVYLGCADFMGADGIAFILQTRPTSVGRTGSGLGFADVVPSIGIALDTYQNTMFGSVIDDLNDPVYDHISIQANGIVRHGNDLAEPVRASAASDDIEDCNWHVLRISWDPAAKELKAYFDGVFRVGATVDLIKDVFGSASSVYWGFSGATGGLTNVQKFCTALNPDFSTNLPNNGTCIGSSVSFTDKSLSFTRVANYHWDFGDGHTSTVSNPGTHSYAAPGVYPVRMAITGMDGCKSDTIQKLITIGSVPDASFNVSDACFKESPSISFSNNNIGTSYQWLVDGTEVSTAAQPQMPVLNTGAHTLERRVISDYGCGTDAATRTLNVRPIPVVEPRVASDVCAAIPNTFTATQQDDNTTIQEWRWSFGDAQGATSQNPTHAYRRAGNYTATLWALASNGCLSDTVAAPMMVHEAFADAGNDTIVLNGVPFQLSGSGNGMAKWTPSTGLDRDNIVTPTATLSNDQRYEFTVTTPEGCVAKDSVRIEVFKGSAIYVPTAFTPNGNGLNDELKPAYVGIKKLYYFAIYNRWGQEVFRTTERARGWDGRHSGKAAGTGTFVWMLRAEDIVGKRYTLKGTFVLVR